MENQNKLTSEDNRNNYYRIRDLLKPLKGKVLTIYELKLIIAQNIGSDIRTIDSALRTCARTGLLKDVNNCRFEVL